MRVIYESLVLLSLKKTPEKTRKIYVEDSNHLKTNTMSHLGIQHHVSSVLKIKCN